eukprot:TRINITY_DN10218_c0_g1_i1.p1 TRINITY_DN10218_c0_g1~~TRINITY_DN10218_c0_g1_i1.p1  ORF type:complete len:327 (+),score=78.45 TRINITY_DN10218_c0_g1_i1:197-1177(+)
MSNSEVVQKARWRMERDEVGDGFETQATESETVRVGAFVLEKERWHRTLDRLAFRWHPFASVRQVDAKDVAAGVLDGVDVLWVGGGSVFDFHEALHGCMARIAQFIERGGAYIGVCAGAFLAAGSGYNGAVRKTALVSAEASWTKGLGSATVTATQHAHAHALLPDSVQPAPHPHQLYFSNGPHFDSPRTSSTSFKASSSGSSGIRIPHGPVTPLLRLTRIHTDACSDRTDFGRYPFAAVHAKLGSGQLFLFGPHPEASGALWGDVLTHIMHLIASSRGEASARCCEDDGNQLVVECDHTAGGSDECVAGDSEDLPASHKKKCNIA